MPVPSQSVSSRSVPPQSVPSPSETSYLEGAVSALTAPVLTLLLMSGLTAVLGTAAEVAVGSPQASGQEMMRFSSDDSLMIREIGAITEMSGDELRVVMVMPGEARPEAYRDVDVREGDVIVVVNGRRIRELAAARDLLDEAAPGDEIALGLSRGGRSVIVRFPKADPASLPDKMVFDGPAGGGGGHGVGIERRMMIQGDGGDLTPLMSLGVILEGDGEDPETVKVSMVLPMGDTALAEGDVLKSIDGRPVTSAAAVVEAVEALDVGSEVQLVVLRDGEEVDVTQAKSDAQGEIRIRR